ncbi:MAG: restriction endonuclease subunit S [Paraprevotella sp.]|nr:restriction endonuclease subunit S [Paraprevotella sp.]
MRKKVCIGDLGTIVTGNTPPRNRPELYGNHTPFIKATDISESEKYTYNPEECYSEEGYNKYIKSLIPKGSTCVVTIGSIGKKMTMAHCDLFINQAMNAIIPNACFDSEYVYYAVKNVLGNIKTLDSGTASGRENVSKSAFSKMEIWVEEELPIQQRIATILSRYDSLIENYQKQIKLLEEFAQRLYKEWFIDLRFPGHENTKIVDGVPEGWVKKTLDSFCNVFTGKKNANQGVSNGKYKFFTCGDTPLLINSYIYDGPAIIISGNGSYTGRTTFYEGKFDLYQRTYACSMKDMQDENLIYGLFELVKCELTNKISGGTHGAAIPYIVMSDVAKFDFLYEENIMRRFSLKMQNILSQSLNLINQIHHITEARDRLLPKLMSGEIKV